MKGMNLENIFTMVVAPAASAVLGWLLGRRKYKTEVNANELDNVQKSVGIYRGMVEDLGKRVDLLTTQITYMQTENEKLSAENRSLKRKIADMDKEIKRLKQDRNEESNSAKQANPA